MEPQERLESWKEIAAYLKRDVRTVQRWEAFESLPVHRHQHQKRGSVYALRHELDAWRDSRRAELFSQPDADHDNHRAPVATPAGAPPRWRTVVAGAAVLVAIVAALLWVRDVRPAPTAPAVDLTMDAPRLLGEALRDGGTFDRIPLEGYGTELAISPDQATLYVSICTPAVSVQAIDLRSRATKWTLGGLTGCPRLVAAATGDRLYLNDATDVLIVDPQTGEARRIHTPAAGIRDLDLTPDERTLFATAVFKGLLAIDTATGVVETISRLPCPVYAALTPAGDRLYVSYQCSGPGGRRGHDAIDVIDTRTRRSVGVITGLAHVGGELVVTPDGSQLWADGLDACWSKYYDHEGCPPGTGAVVNVIRTSDHRVLRSLRAGSAIDFDIRFSVFGDGSGMVLGREHTTVVSTANLRVTESSPLRLSSNVVFSKDRRLAYGALGGATAIAVLPLAAHRAPPAGLTARWTMDGLGLDAVAENDFKDLAPDAYVPGRIGLSVRPEGQPLYISRPPNLGIDSGLVSAMAWVRFDGPTATAAAGTIMEYRSVDAHGWSGWRLLRTPDGRAAVCLGAEGPECEGPNARLITGTTKVPLGRWHHVAFTRDSRQVALYVDGRADGAGTYDGGLPNIENLSFRLGSDEAGTAPLLGRIDEVEIYSRPLTPSEIASRGK